MSVQRAVTFGQRYREEPHPRLGMLAHPDGYIVVEAATHEQVREFLVIICGQEVRENRSGVDRLGATLFAFEYDLEEFEKQGGHADTHYPLGRLAFFSALPKLPETSSEFAPVPTTAHVAQDKKPVIR